MSLKELVRVFWRTRDFILPQMRHLLAYALLIGIATLLELSTFLIGKALFGHRVLMHRHGVTTW